MNDLFRSTTAYRIISEDKRKERLSHAYLITVEDGDLLPVYLKQAAKLIACPGDDYCDECRVCKLIDKNMHPDVGFYPKDKKMSVADADDIVDQSVVKPLELDKRVFVIERPETLNQNQNKLLKTIEEPPKNVYIIMGAEKSSAILPTIRSRAKVVFVPDFTADELLDLTADVFPDAHKARVAALLSGGKIGVMEKMYGDDRTEELFDNALGFLSEARSARDLPGYYSDFSAVSPSELSNTLKVCLNETIRQKCGYKSIIDDKRIKKCADSFPMGALLAISERLCALEKNAYFNGNATMIKDAALFAVLEEKAKWLKL